MTKILVIEDEQALRQEVVDWLGFEGYDAFGAKDGVTGLDCALRQLPDVILCDVTMAGLDGYEVLLELRAHPATMHIPFIFVTARASHEDIRQGMVLGADDYITKPFTRTELLQSIQTRLEKRAVRESRYVQHIEQLQEALAQEREERLLQAKLVAMFSHDFRNQLTVILSSNALVRDYAHRLDEERRRARLDGIEMAARLLIQMLDDMLFVAQIETGNLTLNPEPLDAEQFLQPIVREFQAISGESHCLHLECHADQPVWADARLLRQIAANLISNAIKYSPPGSEVTIQLDNRAGQAILIVKDQGIGIPEADQPHLFDAFRRGTNVGKITGTGLGLAIVKQAVDLQAGSIQVESRVGAGTTVTVTLPCTVPEQ